MKDTKLVSLLKDLTAEDLRQIRKILQSPFFTTNGNLLTFFNVLKKYHPEFDSDKMKKSLVFKKLFPKYDYSDIKLRNLNSDMVRIIEDYLLYKQLHADDFERKKKLAILYRDNGHLDWYERELKKLLNDLNQQPYRDQMYYRQLWQLKLLQLESTQLSSLESRFLLIDETEDALDEFYALSKARNKMSYISLKKIIKPLEASVGKTTKAQNKLLYFFEQLEKLYDSESVDLFQRIKAEFKAHIEKIRPGFQSEILSLLTNFAIKKMELDDVKYNQEVLDLYKTGLRHKIIFTNVRTSDTAYFNIVVSGSKAGDFDWTLDFIESYEHYLLPETKADLKTISLSNFYFHKKDFSKAIDMITAHNFKNSRTKVLARLHALRCFYELFLQDASYYELLISQVESKERYIRRKANLPENKVQSNLNFCSFIKKIATQRISGRLTPDQQKAFLSELSQTEATISRSWLQGLVKR